MVAYNEPELEFSNSKKCVVVDYDGMHEFYSTEEAFKYRDKRKREIECERLTELEILFNKKNKFNSFISRIFKINQ